MDWKANLEIAEKVKENLTREGWPVCGTAVPSGKRYSSMVALWEKHLRPPQACLPFKRTNELFGAAVYSSNKLLDNEDSLNCVNWYVRSAEYWDSCNCGVNDMLGGQDSVDGPDREANGKFLNDLKKCYPSLGSKLATDCGGGIGRVTKGVLLEQFDEVVLVDQSSQYIAAAPAFIGSCDTERVTYLCMGLQDFIPEEQSFDLMWIQWVIGYLTDVDFVKFFRRCQIGLKSGGFIVIKDNMFNGFVLESSQLVDGEEDDDKVVREMKEAFLFDEEDNSIMRSPPYFLSLAREAGLNVVKQRKANEIPKGLHDVYMYALS